MVSKRSSSDISAPNFPGKAITDDNLIRGFILALGAGGRKEKLSISMKEASGCFRTSPREPWAPRSGYDGPKCYPSLVDQPSSEG